MRRGEADRAVIGPGRAIDGEAQRIDERAPAPDEKAAAAVVAPIGEREQRQHIADRGGEDGGSVQHWAAIRRRGGVRCKPMLFFDHGRLQRLGPRFSPARGSATNRLSALAARVRRRQNLTRCRRATSWAARRSTTSSACRVSPRSTANFRHGRTIANACNFPRTGRMRPLSRRSGCSANASRVIWRARPSSGEPRCRRESPPPTRRRPRIGTRKTPRRSGSNNPRARGSRAQQPLGLDKQVGAADAEAFVAWLSEVASLAHNMGAPQPDAASTAPSGGAWKSAIRYCGGRPAAAALVPPDLFRQLGEDHALVRMGEFLGKPRIEKVAYHQMLRLLPRVAGRWAERKRSAAVATRQRLRRRVHVLRRRRNTFLGRQSRSRRPPLRPREGQHAGRLRLRARPSRG